MCPPQNTYLEAPITSVMVFGRDQSTLSPHHVRTQQAGSSLQTRKRDIAWAGTLILNLPVSRSMKNKCILFSSLSRTRQGLRKEQLLIAFYSLKVKIKPTKPQKTFYWTPPMGSQKSHSLFWRGPSPVAEITKYRSNYDSRINVIGSIWAMQMQPLETSEERKMGYC